MKKKIGLLLTMVICVLIITVSVSLHNTSYARTAQLRIEIPEGIKKENEFKVKVVLDSDVELYSIDAYITYDSEKLEFIPDNPCVVGTAGLLELKDTYEGETKNVVYELSFKAVDIGSTNIALKDVFLIDYENLDYMEVASSAKSIQIQKNIKMEMDARLSELVIAPGTLTTFFDPNVFEYEMYVGSDVKELGITAVPKEADSVVALEMPQELQYGENVVLIKVTSLSGHHKNYKIKVYREK